MCFRAVSCIELLFKDFGEGLIHRHLESYREGIPEHQYPVRARLFFVAVLIILQPL